MASDRDPEDGVTPEVPDLPTTAIPQRAAPTRVGPGRPAPGPQPTAAVPVRVPESPSPPRRRRQWPLVVAGVAVVAAAGVAGVAAVFLFRAAAAQSEEESVRTAVTDFAGALNRGDLPTLRAASCGDLAGYYGTVTDADFADVYRATSEDGAVPVLDSIDAVVITESTALAQVTVHTLGAPAATSVRSFALENHDGVWKVCS